MKYFDVELVAEEMFISNSGIYKFERTRKNALISFIFTFFSN